MHDGAPVIATVETRPFDPRRLEPFVGPRRVDEIVRAAAALGALLGGRRIVNVNSTANGGGVAEMLTTLLGYVRGAGLAVDWLVIGGDPEFFRITKRVHNGLYGSPGDGGTLDVRERQVYERTIAANVDSVRSLVRPGDVVIVHDPQPAGIVAPLVQRGAHVIWRCHVGYDGANEWTERAWRFVRPYVETAQAYVFSRDSFAPAWIEPGRLRAIAPSIDPFSPKNQELTSRETLALLSAAGLLAADGTPPDTRVRRRAVVEQVGPPPAAMAPLVVQVSRWDRLKDMTGVLEGFARRVHAPAHLVLAGPAVDGVGDDPEEDEVWQEVLAAWRGLPVAQRDRVHLAAVPMDDPVENALVINALQRHAAVVVQKSLAEGFGLTVAEALWKTRPVVASAVGGIVDQIVDGETGLLVRDPRDLDAFGACVERLLGDSAEARRLAVNGRRLVERRFLGDRHLLQYAELVAELLEPGSGPAIPRGV